ncbi:MAG TPA: HAD-IA family hydrolase [Methylomusa anaerophila]|uniref:Phosphoglycolate phosphatase n=1 Tax=Methylomusa anaerophila TaxID=1930071 RepID=A0A348AQS3_9FIRM|nr:HAD-IA family hydrolase [Methylomusa anaerophila]BBB93421.1 phosphoglycolate phosphatase [Methylomusa anaerophila]HML90046.1 HAD-IA family hydrolase [Methylomusa anaerophila]
MSLFDKKDLFLFDFDGTLINTAPDVQAAVNYMRKKYGLRDFTLKETESIIGRGQAYTINQAITDGINIDFNEAEEIYSKYYQENSARFSTFYPGVIEILNELKVKNKIMAVISNKYSYFVKKILTEMKYCDYFKLICGPDLIAEKKPNPQMVFYAIEQAGASADHTVFIGDSIYDIQTGKNAGITTICVTHGYGNYNEIVNEQPDFLIDNFRDLIAL